ncbi:MAG: class I SAM-dependent methyltransferase [Microthrixaceae bacterium]
MANLAPETGDTYSLGFPDDSFDVVHAHQVLQHLTDPVRALREMRRVLRPGGLLAVRDADYKAFMVTVGSTSGPLAGDLPPGHRCQRCRGRRREASLLGWVAAAGFLEPRYTTSNWTWCTDEDRAWWGGLWAQRVLESDFAHRPAISGSPTAPNRNRSPRRS